METRQLGRLWPVSRVTLSAAGLSSLWGQTTDAEARQAYDDALAAGVDHLDTAPSYGRGAAERLLGDFFAGDKPPHLRVTTKARLGTRTPEETLTEARRSLTRSLETMRIDKVDLFLLHSQIADPGQPLTRREDIRAKLVTDFPAYVEAVIPAMQELVREGLCGAWGITGIVSQQIMAQVLQQQVQPQVAQCIVNPLESAGALDFSAPDADHAQVRRLVHDSDCGLLGIRAVQAGALTDAMDREPRGGDERDFQDYDRAAGFRRLAADMGLKPAELAYRYCFSSPEVVSLVVGVKNAPEMADVLRAEAADPLTPQEMARVAEACGRS